MPPDEITEAAAHWKSTPRHALYHEDLIRLQTADRCLRQALDNLVWLNVDSQDAQEAMSWICEALNSIKHRTDYCAEQSSPEND